MFRTIIGATSVALLIASGAIAQTNTGKAAGAETSAKADSSNSGKGSAGMSMPSGWTGAIGGAFFSDPTAGTLRSDADMRTGYRGLSNEQRAQVKADCKGMDVTAMNALSGSGKAQGQSSSGGTGGESGTTGGSSGVSASIAQVCGMVNAM